MFGEIMKFANIRHHLPIAILALVLTAAPFSAARALDSATFTSDLDALIVKGDELLANMQGTTLSSLTMDSQTAYLASETETYLADVVTVYNTTLDTSSSITLTNTMLNSLETLTATTGALGQEAMRLSAEMGALAGSTTTSSLDASLTSMLQLSADIGTMADRIGEMADRILVMADNIGIMADRIVLTQVIQNGNIELVVNAILVTQQNLLSLAEMYNL